MITSEGKREYEYEYSSKSMYAERSRMLDSSENTVTSPPEDAIVSPFESTTTSPFETMTPDPNPYPYWHEYSRQLGSMHESSNNAPIVTMQMTKTPTKIENVRPDVNIDQHVFLYCIHCMRMIVILSRHEPILPDLLGLRDIHSSMMAATSCRSCEKRNMSVQPIPFVSPIEGKTQDTMRALYLCKHFITDSRAYKVAQIVSNKNVGLCLISGILGHVCMDKVMDGISTEHRIMGIDVARYESGEKSEFLMEFVPGGFV